MNTPANDDRRFAARNVHNYSSMLYALGDWVEIRRLPRRVSTWHRAADLPSLAGQLVDDNDRGENLHIGANPRREHGQRGDDAVPLARCLFADFDDTTIEQADDARKAVGMPRPSMTVNSGHGVHVYWRLAAPIDPQAWREWQKDLAALMGSDPAVCNPERVMRLPGFLNRKREPAVPCCIVECDLSRTYDLADLPIPTRPGTDTPVPVFRVRRVRPETGTGDRVERCRKYLAKCPPAVAGAGGHRATYYAANVCNQFGLTRDEAMELMRWYSERMCDPPWSERELEHKVTDAYARNAGQHGDKFRQDHRSYPPRPVFTVRQKQRTA